VRTATVTTTVPTTTATSTNHAPAATPHSESTEGLPGWGWALIGAGAVALVVLAVNALQRRRDPAAGAQKPSSPPDSSAPPPDGT